jgi:hypothetical protein
MGKDWPVKGADQGLSNFSDRLVNSPERTGLARDCCLQAVGFRLDGHSRCSGKVGVRTASRTGSRGRCSGLLLRALRVSSKHFRCRRRFLCTTAARIAST